MILWYLALVASVLCIGASALAVHIAHTVPDEVRPNRRRFAIARDAIAIIAATAVPAILGQWWIAALVGVALLGYRIALPSRFSWAPLSGVALGAATALSPSAFLGIATLLVVGAFLAGALQRRMTAALVESATHPVGAVAVAVLLTAVI